MLQIAGLAKVVEMTAERGVEDNSLNYNSYIFRK
jgi:hypothetical protein